MWIQFLLENLHFAINLLAALVFFAVFWLYLDAWTTHGSVRVTLRVVGFLFLSLSFLIHASFLETSIIAGAVISKNINLFISISLRILGYLFVLISLAIEPLENKPGIKRPMDYLIIGSLSIPLALTLTHSLFILTPILSSLVAMFYLRRATLGLEDHLKKVALAFFVLSVSEFLSLTTLLEESKIIEIFNLVAPFGPVWLISHLILIITIVLVGRWVFSYLLKRLQSQLFMIYNTSILLIFLTTSVTFTFLLVRNLQQETLKQLETNAKVLNLSVTSLKDQNLADAQNVAQNPLVIASITDSNRIALVEYISKYLLTKKQSSLIVTDENGVVLARGEDREKYGNSLSDDALVRRALLGTDAISLVSREGVLAPEISVRSATPVKSDDKIIGVVITATVLDNAFVTGINRATGLAASIYAGNLISATSLIAQDGNSRPLGLKEVNTAIKTQVLQKGKSYSGSVNLLSLPYFSAYLPLTDIDNNVIGMLMVATPQTGVIASAGRSIELTFLATTILLILSIIPSYMISKFLSEQLR